MKALAFLVLAVATGFGTVNDDDWPPARFRAVGTAQVTFARTQHEIDHLCGKSPRGLYTEGCSTREGRIILPDPCSYPRTDDFAHPACHENAHRFGGWAENHPR